MFVTIKLPLMQNFYVSHPYDTTSSSLVSLMVRPSILANMTAPSIATAVIMLVTLVSLHPQVQNELQTDKRRQWAGMDKITF